MRGNDVRPSLLLGLLTLILTMAPAVGEACEPTTSDPEVDTRFIPPAVWQETFGRDARFYVDNDPCQPECGFSIWIYEESNDIDGLQRGDEMHDDTCGGMIRSDTLACQLLPVALLGRRRREASADGSHVAVGAAALALAGMALVPTADAC